MEENSVLRIQRPISLVRTSYAFYQIQYFETLLETLKIDWNVFEQRQEAFIVVCEFILQSLYLKHDTDFGLIFKNYPEELEDGIVYYLTYRGVKFQTWKKLDVEIDVISKIKTPLRKFALTIFGEKTKPLERLDKDWLLHLNRKDFPYEIFEPTIYDPKTNRSIPWLKTKSDVFPVNPKKESCLWCGRAIEPEKWSFVNGYDGTLHWDCHMDPQCRKELK